MGNFKRPKSSKPLVQKLGTIHQNIHRGMDREPSRSAVNMFLVTKKLERSSLFPSASKISMVQTP